MVRRGISPWRADGGGDDDDDVEQLASQFSFRSSSQALSFVGDFTFGGDSHSTNSADRAPWRERVRSALRSARAKAPYYVPIVTWLPQVGRGAARRGAARRGAG